MQSQVILQKFAWNIERSFIESLKPKKTQEDTVNKKVSFYQIRLEVFVLQKPNRCRERVYEILVFKNSTNQITLSINQAEKQKLQEVKGFHIRNKNSNRPRTFTKEKVYQNGWTKWTLVLVLFTLKTFYRILKLFSFFKTITLKQKTNTIRFCCLCFICVIEK